MKYELWHDKMLKNFEDDMRSTINNSISWVSASPCMKPIDSNVDLHDEIRREIITDSMRQMWDSMNQEVIQETFTCSSNPYTDIEHKLRLSMFENKLKTALPQPPQIMQVPQIGKQKRKHKKKRINKKWLKRYGLIYVDVIKNSEVIHDTYNNVVYANKNVYDMIIDEYEKGGIK